MLFLHYLSYTCCYILYRLVIGYIYIIYILSDYIINILDDFRITGYKCTGVMTHIEYLCNYLTFIVYLYTHIHNAVVVYVCRSCVNIYIQNCRFYLHLINELLVIYVLYCWDDKYELYACKIVDL